MTENPKRDFSAGSHAGEEVRDTEGRVQAGPLDEMSALGILRTLNAEDQSVAEAVEKALPQIAMVVEAAVQGISGGGRLIYAGAGSSGRLAAQDAIECAPTFGVPRGTVLWTLAGGEKALATDEEGVEDDSVAGRMEISNLDVDERDLIIGVSASGNTPYTCAALVQAQERGASTACVVNAGGSKMAHSADYPVEIHTGYEVIAGSTRLKAGTAQKMALNMISTATMTRLGYVYEHLMVGVVANNFKLRKRAERIVREIKGCGEQDSRGALERADYDVRVAVLLMDGVYSATEARRLLKESCGSLRPAREMAIFEHREDGEQT